MLPWGVSIHLTTLTGASCWATCCACPVWMSKRRAALSPPPEIILFPSYGAWFGRIQTRFSETCVLTLFQQTDRTGAWCPYIAFPCVWPFCPTSYIRTCEGHYAIRTNVNEQKKSRLTLLSQLPTARKSATGQKESEEIESGGGSATSTSFSGAEETFAAVEFAPKKDMVQ